MSDFHQKKLMTIAFFALYIVLFANPIDGSAAESHNHVVTRVDGYYPPRVQQLCYNNFIGTDWNKSMKYKKRCRVLWTAWTEEEKSHSPY